MGIYQNELGDGEEGEQKKFIDEFVEKIYAKSSKLRDEIQGYFTGIYQKIKEEILMNLN